MTTSIKTIKNLPNFEAIKENYLQAFEELSTKSIEELSINDLSQIKNVSYGSIKSMKVKAGYSNEAILSHSSKSRPLTKDLISNYIKSLSKEELKELLK